MAGIQNSFERSWEGRSNKYGRQNSIIDDRIRAHSDYKALRDLGLDAKSALDSFNNSTLRSVWNWGGIYREKITRIDSIKQALSLLHNAIMAADPSTGEILLWLGGNDFGTFQYDNILARRQVGSLFKPIEYLAALEKGVKPCDYYKNELVSYGSYDNWTPRNSDGQYGNYFQCMVRLQLQ
jgi:penicillin-binding protein 1A